MIEGGSFCDRKARDLFDKLMTQIQLDDTAKEHPLIQNGRIDKVIVHHNKVAYGNFI